MIWLQYFVVLVCVASLICVYFLPQRFNKKINKQLFVKILSILLLVLFFVRYMSGNDVLGNTIKLKNNAVGSKFVNWVALIVNWFMYAIELCLALYPFFKKDFVKNIIKFFALPFSVLAIVALYPASVGIVGKSAYFAFNFRAIMMSVEFAVAFVLSFVVFFEEGKFRANSKECLKLLYIVPLMIMAFMPPYMFRALFGLSKVMFEAKDLSPYHRFVLYLSILLPLGLYFLLTKKDTETKRLCLLYISLATLFAFSFNHKFDSFLNITRWPFHLCNTAMYLVPLCLAFKTDKLFYFTLFINVLGAFLAMAMPNYSDNLNVLSPQIMEFYINHYIAFFMPILIVALGLYERPKFKQFVYSVIAFTVYFVLILIINAWFSNYATIDYFFVNSDFIAEKLGRWAEDLRDITWKFKIGKLNFKFYPLYQFLFYLVYVALGAGMWFLYEWAYQGADLLKDMAARNQKIKQDHFALMAQLNGRSEEEPMNEEGKNQLKLIHFSKRYGRSNVFAVKDANLVVEGGQVFGFLGPNGAGKSTIIKSIVGIQPITEGSIEVCGYPVEKQPVMAKRQIGFVPDHYALYEKLTGREYINYIADLYGVSKADRNERIKKYVDLLEMGCAIDNKMNTYSHGMKQKITIISALIHDPKVWILDEPLTGLDPNSIFQVKECMRQHAEKGNIVFFSSHIIDVVERICDKIAIIKKGHILTCRDVEDIKKETTLEEFYLKTIETKVYATKVSNKDGDTKCEKKNWFLALKEKFEAKKQARAQRKQTNK